MQTCDFPAFPGQSRRLLDHLQEAKRPVRARELKACGFHTALLTFLVQAGLVEQIGRGIYVAASVGYSVDDHLVEFALRYPESVVSGLSALMIHGLTVRTSAWVEGTRLRRSGMPNRNTRLLGGLTPVHWTLRARLPDWAAHSLRSGVIMRLEAPHAAVADVVVRHETFPDDTAADVCRAYMREGGDPKAVVGALRKSCAPANLLSFADEFLASNFTRSGL